MKTFFALLAASAVATATAQAFTTNAPVQRTTNNWGVTSYSTNTPVQRTTNVWSWNTNAPSGGTYVANAHPSILQTRTAEEGGLYDGDTWTWSNNAFRSDVWADRFITNGSLGWTIFIGINNVGATNGSIATPTGSYHVYNSNHNMVEVTNTTIVAWSSTGWVNTPGGRINPGNSSTTNAPVTR